ncbi:MAG: inositol monophosphatase [Bacteroidetes bacterium]|nr:inositol monophosphatase [Bacteroidota bacterium]
MSHNLNLSELHEAVKSVLKECRKQFFESTDYHSLDLKGLNQLVTNNDIAVEKFLTTRLAELTPEAGFLTEEETVVQEKNDLRWIIDPIDGTTNYVHKIPVFSISVALQFRSETILGFVYELNRDELFSAFNGKAFCNDSPISVNKESTLENSLVATGFPYYTFEGLDKYLEVLVFAMKNTRGVRRLGSAAVDLAYVACGRFDVFFEYGLNAWDVAAGAYITECAGGKVSDFSGYGDPIFGRQILAGSPVVFEDFLPEVRKMQ